MVQHVHEEYIRAGAEVIIANTYASSRAPLEPAGLGISAFHREDGTLSTLLERGDGDSVEDLLSALAGPELAAITVMHSKAEASLAAVESKRMTDPS